MAANAPPAGREVPLAVLQDQMGSTEPVTAPAADPRSKTGQEVRAPLPYLFLILVFAAAQQGSDLERCCRLCSPTSAAGGLGDWHTWVPLLHLSVTASYPALAAGPFRHR
jgi:hypothetical protein